MASRLSGSRMVVNMVEQRGSPHGEKAKRERWDGAGDKNISFERKNEVMTAPRCS